MLHGSIGRTSRPAVWEALPQMVFFSGITKNKSIYDKGTIHHWAPQSFEGGVVPDCPAPGSATAVNIVLKIVDHCLAFAQLSFAKTLLMAIQNI